MSFFNLNIDVDGFNVGSNTEHLYHQYWKVSKYKGIEVEAIKSTSWLKLSINVTTSCNHPGVRLELGLLGYEGSSHFYDGRHWDYDNNRFETYEETNEKHSPVSNDA